MDIAQNMNRDSMVEVLRENVVQVTFTKKDGTVRVMNCTLQESFLPESNTESSNRKINDNLVTVWDVDVNGWRSFNCSSVQTFGVMNG